MAKDCSNMVKFDWIRRMNRTVISGLNLIGTPQRSKSPLENDRNDEMIGENVIEQNREKRVGKRNYSDSEEENEKEKSNKRKKRDHSRGRRHHRSRHRNKHKDSERERNEQAEENDTFVKTLTQIIAQADPNLRKTLMESASVSSNSANLSLQTDDKSSRKHRNPINNRHEQKRRSSERTISCTVLPATPSSLPSIISPVSSSSCSSSTEIDRAADLQSRIELLKRNLRKDDPSFTANTTKLVQAPSPLLIPLPTGPAQKICHPIMPSPFVQNFEPNGLEKELLPLNSDSGIHAPLSNAFNEFDQQTELYVISNDGPQSNCSDLVAMGVELTAASKFDHRPFYSFNLHCITSDNPDITRKMAEWNDSMSPDERMALIVGPKAQEAERIRLQEEQYRIGEVAEVLQMTLMRQKEKAQIVYNLNNGNERQNRDEDQVSMECGDSQEGGMGKEEERNGNDVTKNNEDEGRRKNWEKQDKDEQKERKEAEEEEWKQMMEEGRNAEDEERWKHEEGRAKEEEEWREIREETGTVTKAVTKTVEEGTVTNMADNEQPVTEDSLLTYFSTLQPMVVQPRKWSLVKVDDIARPVSWAPHLNAWRRRCQKKLKDLKMAIGKFQFNSSNSESLLTPSKQQDLLTSINAMIDKDQSIDAFDPDLSQQPTTTAMLDLKKINEDNGKEEQQLFGNETLEEKEELAAMLNLASQLDETIIDELMQTLEPVLKDDDNEDEILKDILTDQLNESVVGEEQMINHLKEEKTNYEENEHSQENEDQSQKMYYTLLPQSQTHSEFQDFCEDIPPPMTPPPPPMTPPSPRSSVPSPHTPSPSLPEKNRRLRLREVLKKRESGGTGRPVDTITLDEDDL